MNARYSQGYVVSFLLHGAAVAGVLLLAYLANQSTLDKPKVLELVAGEGNNYGATEAPAIGVPGGIKAVLPPAPSPIPPVEVPPTPPVEATPPPTTESVPVEPVPTPEAPTPKPTTKPTPTKAKTAPKPPPTFAKSVVRTINHRAARLEAKYRKQQAEADRREKLSYDQYMKTHGGPPGSQSKSDPEGSRHGVLKGSTNNKGDGANGKALTREDGSLLEAYFALLKARAHENFEPPLDVSDKLVARVSFYLAADGSISHVQISRSSGNAAFDQAVLSAFHRTHSIGPRPDHHGEDLELAFSLREEDGG